MSNSGTSVATTGNAATLDFTYATIGSLSSVNVRSRAGPSVGCTPVAACTPSAAPNASLISVRSPTNASSSGVRLTISLASNGRLTSTTSSDVRKLSIQQSTSSATGQKRNISTTLRGGETLAYKKPRPKKAKTGIYIVLHCQVQLLQILIFVTNQMD
ncbi:hypothetical protein EJD97_001718 [Solanum chilense]|uniref:Uncharacterized protein n=1 Tax=Solanum chilense TaxID=4083 RepID=A0A6N2BZ40_SOLCI|nr:hypothetical protein EJD97_001718 [Solanum chilense]